MSKRSQEKRRARSKEKKLAKRRLQGSSPLSRLADVQHCECWMTASSDDRMLGIQVLRPVRGGTTAAAIFLIDRDCIGLKDAFYQTDVDPAALRESLRLRSEVSDTRVTRIDLEQARKTVAEAICWTRQHPFFRMPPETDRCVKILGGVGDIDAADVSDFGKDGKLFYVGRKVDLEPCLLTMDVFEFMERDDVECIFHQGNATFGDIEDDFEEGFDDEYEDEDEEEDEEEDEDGMLLEGQADEAATAEELRKALESMREQAKRNMLDAVRKWCFKQAIMPEPELEAAVNLSLDASFQAAEQTDETAVADTAAALFRMLVSKVDPSRQKALVAAHKQLQEFARLNPQAEEVMSGHDFNAT